MERDRRGEEGRKGMGRLCPIFSIAGLIPEFGMTGMIYDIGN